MADSKLANYKKFSEILRESYRASQRDRDLQWPPRFAEKLVKLILHEEVYNVYYNKRQRGGDDHYSSSNRVQIQYDGIFQNKPGGSIVMKVVVEGDAGIGKTTLCTSISMDWAEHKRLKQFDLLLLIPLRMKKFTSVKSIVELLQLFCDDEDLCKCVADSFSQGSFGKEILIIADGWDEVQESECQPGSFMYKLLFGYDVISFATVMVTSRPRASIELHKNSKIDRFIEIAGFDIRGIIQYINSEFSAQEDERSGARLLQRIRDNPLIRSICHVPINCAIICRMWRNDETLPLNLTMTDMYTKIILHFIFRALKKSFPEFHLENLKSFDDIPQELQEGLLILCKFAYNALVKDKFVFSYDEVKDVFPQAVGIKSPHGDQLLFSFGLMQTSQAFLGVGRGASFHFIHRTFQEYLCAFHMARQPQQIQNDLMKPYAYTSRMAKPLQFLIGIATRGDCISRQIMSLSADTVCDVFKLDNRLRIACAGWTNDLIVHGICEAKESEVKSYLLDIVYGDCFTFAFPRNAYDCAAVINAIKMFPGRVNERSQSARTVSFKLEHCGLDEELVANLAHALRDTNGNLKVKKLFIQDNKLCDAAISNLMNQAALEFKSLKQLNLAANSLGAEAVNSIGKHLGTSCIESLTLSYNPLGTSGAISLQNVIEMETFANLTDLQLKNCSLNHCEAYMSLLQALPDHCASLKQLDISENCVDMCDALGSMLGYLLLNHSTLRELYANGINFRDEGVKALTDVLNTCGNVTDISVLSIKANDIQPMGISSLVKCIQSSHLSVSDSLCVDGNPILLSGTIYLASVLNTMSVSMSNCQLTKCAEDLKQQLADELSKLPQTQVCQELILDNNCFTGEHIHVLMELIRLCPRLNSLSCAECEICSKDLKLVLTHARDSDSLRLLETWSLQNNKIDSMGCSLLVTAVSSYLPKLNGVFVHGNGIIHKKIYHKLEQESAKHRPKGDTIQDVVTTVLPGVRYDEIQLNIVKRHIAFENFEDEDYDPVLLLDEYCRIGEEQMQNIEMVTGWLMSLKEEDWKNEIMKYAASAFSQESQEYAAGITRLLGNLRHLEYNQRPHIDEEEDILDEEQQKGQAKDDNQTLRVNDAVESLLKSGLLPVPLSAGSEAAETSECIGGNVDEVTEPQSKPISFPGIALSGISPSFISSLATQFLGNTKVTPELVSTITQLGKSLTIQDSEGTSPQELPLADRKENEQESVTQQTETNGSIKPSSSVNDVENPHSGDGPGGIPASLISSLATQFLGGGNVNPGLVSAITQIGQSLVGSATLECANSQQRQNQPPHPDKDDAFDEANCQQEETLDVVQPNSNGEKYTNTQVGEVPGENFNGQGPRAKKLKLDS